MLLFLAVAPGSSPALSSVFPLLRIPIPGEWKISCNRCLGRTVEVIERRRRRLGSVPQEQPVEPVGWM